MGRSRGADAVGRPELQPGTGEGRTTGREDRRHHPVAGGEVEQLEHQRLGVAQNQTAPLVRLLGDPTELHDLVGRRQQRALRRPESRRRRPDAGCEHVVVRDLQAPGDAVVGTPFERLPAQPRDAQDHELPKARIEQPVDEERLEEAGDVPLQRGMVVECSARHGVLDASARDGVAHGAAVTVTATPDARGIAVSGSTSMMRLVSEPGLTSRPWVIETTPRRTRSSATTTACTEPCALVSTHRSSARTPAAAMSSGCIRTTGSSLWRAWGPPGLPPPPPPPAGGG